MNVLIYTFPWGQNISFFKKFVGPLKTLGYYVHFLTIDLYDYLIAKKQGHSVFLVENSKKRYKVPRIDELRPEECTNLEETNKLYSCVLETCNNLHNKYHFEKIIAWGGLGPACQGIKTFAAQHAIPTLFFELANIDGKMFADPQGVNAKSYLYNNIHLLDEYDIDPLIFDQWKQNYITRKLENHTVYQALAKPKKLIHRFPTFRILESYKRLFLGTPSIPTLSCMETIRQKQIHQKVSYTYDSTEHLKTPYLFLPLQVSNDSQLIFNSDIDNLQAIKIASEMAKEKGLKLIIKPHPAEPDQQFVKHVYELKNNYNFYFINYNTFRLIQNSAEVLTINSTVGLEAKIMGKKVHFLGRTFLKELTPNRLKNYILGYLVDMNNFTQESISVATMQKALDRSELTKKDIEGDFFVS